MSPGFTGGTDDFSVEFWVKTSNPTLDIPILGSVPFGSGSLGIIITNGGNQLDVTTNSPGSAIAYAIPPLQTNIWTYFAISRSGTTESVWVDGAASITNPQTDGRTYAATTDTIFNTNGVPQTANVTNIKVNVGKTYLDPTLSPIPVPSTSLTADPETKLLMNTLLASSVFTDTSGTQSSITINSGTVIYLVDSPY